MIKTARCMIRPIDESQLSGALDVYLGCEDFLALCPEPSASAEMVLSDMKLSKAQGGTYCGIWDGSGKMIGIVDYVANGFDHSPETGFLSLLMIAGSHRRLGYGAEVVIAVEQMLAEEFCARTIFSAVQTDNEPAIRFWKKMGYQIVSGPEPQPDGTVTCRLRKDLRDSPNLSL